jgi:predicted secreted protein
MATSAIAGYKGVIAMSSSAGGSVTAIAEIRNFNVNITHSAIDATSHDSSGDTERIAGTNTWSGSADALHVLSNATHKNLIDTIINRNKVQFEFYPSGSSSDGHYAGTGFLSDWDESHPNDDAVAVNVSYEGTGAIARTSSST